MRIAVCVKQVPDTETKIQVKPGETSISADGVTYVINPYDEFAKYPFAGTLTATQASSTFR